MPLTNAVPGGTMGPGTNAYYLVMRDYLSDEEVVEFFRVTSQNGLKLVRIFAFVNGTAVLLHCYRCSLLSPILAAGMHKLSPPHPPTAG